MLAAATCGFSSRSFAETKIGLFMLLAMNDPFCGLDILRMRYVAGRRPSADTAGDALSWLISGQIDFGHKSLEKTGL